eukprot:Em0011g957a
MIAQDNSTSIRDAGAIVGGAVGGVVGGATLIIIVAMAIIIVTRRHSKPAGKRTIAMRECAAYREVGHRGHESDDVKMVLQQCDAYGKRQSGGYTSHTFPPTTTSGDINNLNPNGVYQFSVVAQVTIMGQLYSGEMDTSLVNTPTITPGSSNLVSTCNCGGVLAGSLVAEFVVLVVTMVIINLCIIMFSVAQVTIMGQLYSGDIPPSRSTITPGTMGGVVEV